jgi:hypothetical protein
MTDHTTNDAKRYARVPIANAEALIAAGASLRVELGAGTDAISFASLAVLTPKELKKAGGVFPLPRMHAGGSYAVRMRAEKHGMRPGPYTAPIAVTLQPLAPPSALTIVGRAGDASIADLTWVPGERTVRQELRIREAGRTSWRTRFALPGSTGAALDALKPGKTYEIEVRHRELPPYKGVSTSVTATFTTRSEVRTLLPPTNPKGLVTRTGTFGMEVTAAEVPTVIAFEVAVEIAPDSGLFGPYQESPMGTRTAVAPPGRTQFTRLAPADGRSRRIRARAMRHGATASDWCPFVEVLPYSAEPDGTPTTSASRRKKGIGHRPTQ